MTLFLQIGKERPSLCLGGESTAECTAGPAGGYFGVGCFQDHSFTPNGLSMRYA